MLFQLVNLMTLALSAAPLAPGPSHPAPHVRPITAVKTVEPKVAITFDACATRGQANGFDKGVMKVLERESVPATIFVSGRWVDTHPAAMADLTGDALIEFGNHSYDHPHMSRLSG